MECTGTSASDGEQGLWEEGYGRRDQSGVISSLEAQRVTTGKHSLDEHCRLFVVVAPPVCPRHGMTVRGRGGHKNCLGFGFIESPIVYQ